MKKKSRLLLAEVRSIAFDSEVTALLDSGQLLGQDLSPTQVADLLGTALMDIRSVLGDRPGGIADWSLTSARSRYAAIMRRRGGP